MPVKAGKAPWSRGYSGYKQTTKPTVNKLNRAAGFISQQYEGEWKTRKRAKMKQITLQSGLKVKVPDADYEAFIGFSAEEGIKGTIEDYIDEGFYSSEGLIEQPGVGHIKNLYYSPSHKMMWADFRTDDAVVVYLYVPMPLFAELQALAISGATSINSFDGSTRHVLGIRFWDLVRIRGQRYGSRYPFHYQLEGNYEAKGTEFTREREADRAAGPGVKVADTDEELYDRMARNMLSNKNLDEYNKLKDVKDKEKLLRKEGIL